MPYYAVHKGRKTGVFRTWRYCFSLVNKYSGAQFKKFENLPDAKYYVQHGTARHLTKITAYFKKIE